MSTHNHSNTSSFTQVQEKNLKEFNEERFIPHQVMIPFDDLADPTLTHAECRVYATILAYGKKYGHLSISYEKLLKDFPVFSEKQFREHCQSLEEKRFIYRIQHPLHKHGSMRYLIPKLYYDKFIFYILKRFKDTNKAAQVKVFFEGGDYDTFKKAYQSQIKSSSHKIVRTSPKFKSSTAGLSSARPDRRLNLRPINNINIIKEEENGERKNAAPFLEKLKKELDKSRLDWHTGCQLYESNPDYWSKRNNPIGAIIQALREGYADECIERERRKREGEERISQTLQEKRKRQSLGKTIAFAIQTQVKKLGWLLTFDEYVCQVDTSTGCYNFPYDEKGLQSLKRFSLHHKLKWDK